MTTNITVKNGAATPVDKTFQVARSAAGDESAVLFIREGLNVNAFPKFEFSTKAVQINGQPGRQATETIVVPYGTELNGVFTKINAIQVTITAKVPNDAPDSVRADAAAFTTGLPADAQVRDLIRKGYAT